MTGSKKTDKKHPIERKENGNVVVTFKIPWEKVKVTRAQVAGVMAEKITVPGFRPGKAPVEQAIKYLPQENLIENTLSKILPQLFSEAIKQHNLNPAIYPKFDLVQAKEGEEWIVRATTCEIPAVEIAEYEKKVKEIKIGKKAGKEEKEHKIIDTLLEASKVEIPEMIIEEEVNSRLSSLLSRIEQLGLTLESYLASAKKTAPQLRQEYSTQAEKSIKLDLVLQKIADEQKIKVEEKEVEDYLNASSSGQKNVKHSQQQKETVKAYLCKRKALDWLTGLL